MGINSAFQEMGLSVSITTQVTTQSTPIKLTDIGLPNFPSQFRWVNNGTADVWIDISDAAATAAFPTAGTTTAGTPTFGWRMKPGIVEVSGLVIRRTQAAGAALTQLFVNTIGLAGGGPIDLTFGEGL
jgi:hypothetical protein